MSSVKNAFPIFVSVILCTRDRPADLARTLESILACDVPPGIDGELIVVENGSDGRSRDLVGRLNSKCLALRFLNEPRKGKVYALNTALRIAKGSIFLFTDDDVRVPPNWITEMIKPILFRGADAVAGGVELGEELLRAWMVPRHRSWLAATERLNPESPGALIGANMALARRVFERIPSFDVELGVGALGSGEETLLAYQIERAEYRIVSAFDVVVKHHFSPERLHREAFLDKAVRGGRSEAYIDHHWSHLRIPLPRCKQISALLRLVIWRMCHLSEVTRQEGCAEREMLLVRRYSTLSHYRKEAKRPRNYECLGLRKVRGIQDRDVLLKGGSCEGGSAFLG